LEQRAKVLLIDDDVDFVRINRTFLERRFDVAVAYDGTEGMARAREVRPDVIVLDVMMEELNEGFDVVREVRNDPDLQRTPIIMLTSVNRMLRPLHFEADEDWLPVSVFLDKPVSPERLMEEIDRLIQYEQGGRSDG